MHIFVLSSFSVRDLDRHRRHQHSPGKKSLAEIWLLHPTVFVLLDLKTPAPATLVHVPWGIGAHPKEVLVCLQLDEGHVKARSS
jgi:hypothetical protein